MVLPGSSIVEMPVSPMFLLIRLMPSLAVHYDSLRMRGSRPMHWPQLWALEVVIHEQFLSGCMLRMAIVVIGVPMVLGREIVPIVLTGCGEFEVFGMGITANFAVSTGAGIPMSGYLRVLGINGCTLLIFIREQMCRSM